MPPAAVVDDVLNRHHVKEDKRVFLSVAGVHHHCEMHRCFGCCRDVLDVVECESRNLLVIVSFLRLGL